MIRTTLTAILLTLVSIHAYGASIVSDPCGGPAGLLAELDRPTVADSACVAKPGRVIVEMGFAHANTYPQAGTSNNFPEAELRFGLPDNNEFVLLPPNYTRTSISGQTEGAYNQTVIGLKHEFGYNSRWTYAAETLFTTPATTATGQPTTGWGTAINGIVAYNVTPSIGVGLMLGVTSLYDAEGVRYTSINPDFTATWELTDQLQLYGELYGQSHVAHNMGSGWDADGGVQYLLNTRWEIDAELGTRVSGALGGYSHYIGFGTGFEF